MSLYPTPQSRGGTGLAWDLTLASVQKKSLGTQVPEGMGHGKARPWPREVFGEGVSAQSVGERQFKETVVCKTRKAYLQMCPLFSECALSTCHVPGTVRALGLER